VAVGHTADDQAETILHRLLRGTGIHGLAGMPPSRSLGPRVTLVRPLLGFRRREVLEYLAQRGQAFCIDETNVDPGYTRNRLRSRLLPALEAEYNPRVVEAILRLGEQAAQFSRLVQSLGAEAYGRALIAEDPTGFTLDCRALAREQPVVVREALAHGWRRRAWPEGSMSARHWNRLMQMVAAGDAAQCTLPRGITAVRREGWLKLSR
jgi:tRNA(Ile)-lysidine synthase